MEIPIIVQHRHVHLSQEHIRVLFGDAGLAPRVPVDQKGQFVAEGLVSVHGPNGSFPEVCVIGPSRAQTQVELSCCDAFAIGIQAPIRLSGDLARSASVLLKTPLGEVLAKASTIIPIRHLHVPPSAASLLGVSHHDVVSVQVKGHAGLRFDHVVVRVHPTFVPAFHLTKDEAAAGWVQTGDIAFL